LAIAPSSDLRARLILDGHPDPSLPLPLDNTTANATTGPTTDFGSNTHFAGINKIFAAHCVVINSRGPMSGEAWNAAFFGNPPHVKNAEKEVTDHAVEELVFIGRCWYWRVGRVNTRCGNCRNTCIPLMGRCDGCDVISEVVILCGACEGSSVIWDILLVFEY